MKIQIFCNIMIYACMYGHSMAKTITRLLYEHTEYSKKCFLNEKKNSLKRPAEMIRNVT